MNLLLQSPSNPLSEAKPEAEAKVYASNLEVPFEDIFDYWDSKTAGGTNIPAIKALCLWDRYFLLVQIFSRRDVLHPWLYSRCREAEANPDGYLDLWARAHYKSTIITYAGAIQEILRDPDIAIGVFSHTSPIAKAFLKQIKLELERNDKLKDLFPEILWQNPQADAPSWSVDAGIVVKRSANKKEATIEAHGLVDGQPTSKHFDLMIYDDVVVAASVSTSEQIAKTTEAYQLSDNLGTEHVRKWMVGTRWSFADSYDAIIKTGAAKVRMYPATHDGTMTGKPVLLSPEVLARKLIDQGDYVFSCQMLQNPIAGTARMFNPEDLNWYEIRPSTLNVYIVVDPARSKKKGSDNTAMAVIGIDSSYNKYLLDGFNHKMNLSERWDNLARLWLRWKQMPGVNHIDVGYEAFAAQADLDYFQEQMRFNKITFSIKELMWPRDGEGSKVDRVQRLGPDLREHKILIPAPAMKTLTRNQQRMKDGGEDHRIGYPIRKKGDDGRMYDLGEHLVEQITYFPYAAKKDLIDAVSRIYDMEPKAPRSNEPQYAEPEIP